MRFTRIRPSILLSLALSSMPFATPPLPTLRAQAPPPKLDSYDLDRAHTMLKQAFDEVRKNYYDPSFHGVDLEAAYHQNDARLSAARTNSECFRVIAAFLSSLHDSHTFLIPPGRVNRSTMGFTMQMIGDDCFITQVRPKTDAAAKLHRGDQVLSLSGFKVDRTSFETMEYFFHVLSPAPAETLEVVSPDGKHRLETVRALIRPGKAVLDLSNGTDSDDYLRLLLQDEDADHRNRATLVDKGDVVLWKMPSFEVPHDVVDDTFSRARKYKTIIVDLRGNSGGYVDTLNDMLAYFFDHEIKLGDRVMRKKTKPEMIKPRSNPFTGKLIVLVDSDSASAAELFARTVQIEHRGTVIGDRSAGAVMEARDYEESLGTSDKQVLYSFSITSANLLMSDGKSLETTGVSPDEVFLPTAADLAAGRDPVLAHAAEGAGVQMDPVAAGKLFPYEWPAL